MDFNIKFATLMSSANAIIMGENLKKMDLIMRIIVPIFCPIFGSFLI